ncbi:MAG TPA: 3-oxoacyl-ACP reductase [Verrucomicrobiae bacterium]|nr:3-oxoacyl-ACP reductase [Verrucomicrobiae bacterium]
MSDRYLEITQTPWGQALVSALGLPNPPRLARSDEPWAEAPLAGHAVVFGAGEGGTLTKVALQALKHAGATVQVRTELPGFAAIKSAAAELGIALTGAAVAGEGAAPAHAIVYDASGIARPEGLRALYDFFRPLAAQVPSNGRVVVIGRAADANTSAPGAAAQGALLGFVKSLGKEIGRKGATANLIEVGSSAETGVAGALRFFLSPHSAFVSGQSLPLSVEAAAPAQWTGSLGGKVALVTGAARGIGAAIAQVLAREGATVVGMDRPQEEGALGHTLAPLNGVGLPLDVTASDAPARIVQETIGRFGGLDIVVHNAGITRDKTLRNMKPEHWDQVIGVNLAAIVRVNDELLKNGLKPGARMVCISSIGGIAGNPGQTNYGATKAGVIAYVRALAPEMARRGGAVNAVAPGFIETQMTSAMPVGPRVVGRLMSSLLQGGLPQDIAEAVGFLASPHASGINGRTLRVCGQHLVGA